MNSSITYPNNINDICRFCLNEGNVNYLLFDNEKTTEVCTALKSVNLVVSKLIMILKYPAEIIHYITGNL